MTPTPPPAPAATSTAPGFSHVAGFTGYMALVEAEVLAIAAGRRLRVLDLPAGNGLLVERLRAQGLDAIGGDINRERPDYAYVDMERPLPFPDGHFDVTVCMEGIEHLLHRDQLLEELVRITRPGGRIVISTPNVSSFWSRLVFLFTGHFYQFAPSPLQRLPQEGDGFDKGHIAPIALFDLAFQMAAFGAPIEKATGDRIKKKAVLPLYLLLAPAMAMARRRALRGLKAGVLAPGARAEAVFGNRRVLLSRSLVAVFRKRGD